VNKFIISTTLSAFLGIFLLPAASSAENIVVNGDFEGSTYVEYGDNLPDNWELYPTDNSSLSSCGVSNAVNSAIDLGPESGTNYMTFQSRETDGSQDCLFQQLPTVTGQQYLITFSVAITSGSLALDAFLDPEWDEGGANDTFLRNSYYYPTSTNTTTGSVPYETFSFIETASQSTTTFFFHGVDATGGSILVDNLSISPLPPSSTNYLWAGGPKGNWDTNSTKWLSGTNTTKETFVYGSSALFTNDTAMTITNEFFNGGVFASNVTVSNNTGTVSFSRGILNATSLTLASSGALVVKSSLVITNGIDVTTNGTLSLLNTNIIGQGVSISAGGKLIIGNNLSLGLNSLSLSNAILSPNKTVTGLANPITLGTGAGTISNVASLTLSGDIDGIGGLIKSGRGSLTLTGNNSYSGGTRNSEGTLAGTTTSLEGGIINYATLLFMQSGSGTFTGSISGNGKLINAGSGGVTLSGTNSFSGGTTISLGNLAASSLGSGVLLIKPSKGKEASFSDTLSNGTLDLGALTLSGNSAIYLENPYTTIRSTNAAVTITGTNNFIDLSGTWTNIGTYPLLTGTKLAGRGLKSLDLKGSFIGGDILSLGGKTNYGGLDYSFTNTASSLELIVSTAASDVDLPPLNSRFSSIGVIIKEDGVTGGGKTTLQAVPEPSTYALLGMGMGTLVMVISGRRWNRLLIRGY
jgi:autotransporter-associated beta strand protein